MMTEITQTQIMKVALSIECYSGPTQTIYCRIMYKRVEQFTNHYAQDFHILDMEVVWVVKIETKN